MISFHHDPDPVVARLATLLTMRACRLVTAESCTGGLIAARLTDRAGSSAWFDRAYVTYSNRAKQQMLGVSGALFPLHGAVSEAVVRAMTEGALRCSGEGAALAVSGIAGPGGGSTDKPVGTVWFAWGLKHEGGVETDAATQRFYGDRALVREQAVAFALAGMIEHLEAYV